MATSMETFNWDQLPVKTAATANPAAGANPAAVTVPAGKRWLLLYANCFCDTSANAANRVPVFQVKADGTNDTYKVAVGLFVAGDGDQNISIVQGYGVDFSTSGAMCLPIPAGGVEMPAGAVFQLTIAAIDAADDCGPLYYAYKEV